MESIDDMRNNLMSYKNCITHENWRLTGEIILEYLDIIYSNKSSKYKIVLNTLLLEYSLEDVEKFLIKLCNEFELKNLSLKSNNPNYIIPQNTFKRVKVILLYKLKNIFNSLIEDANLSNKKYYLKENYNTVNYEINSIIKEIDILPIKESELSAKEAKIQTIKIKRENILKMISDLIVNVQEIE